jgi:hypothetical protein
LWCWEVYTKGTPQFFDASSGTESFMFNTVNNSPFVRHRSDKLAIYQ